jgi:ATP-dependent helicase/nuclease subunit A
MLLLRELATQEELWKEEKGVVLLKDIEQMIFRLLSEDEMTFIYERTGNEIRHILIDEFQDTSERQWTNLLPLILESVSKGGEVTIVGDAKQAIYRWRGGDSSLINALPLLTNSTIKTFTQLQSNSLEHYLSSEKVLGNNYRSSPNVVAFNNAIFEKIGITYSQVTASTYRDVHQEPVQNLSSGFVDFQFNTEPSTKEAFQSWAKSKLLERLDELRSRGFRGNDIAILVRKGEESEMILNWLNEAGIQAVSPDSLLLQSSPQVRLLVDLLKWLTVPSSTALNTKIYLQLTAKKSSSNIAASPIHRIAQADNAELQHTVFLDILKEMGYEIEMNSLRSLPPFGQILELIHVFRLDTSDDSLLASWLNIVHNECLRNDRNLSEILEMWEWNKSAWRLESLDSVEAVNVLTIHKAKGLAWPIVILYHFNWPKTGNNVWVKLDTNRWILPYAQISENCMSSQVLEQLEEESGKKFLDELNTFYVAFTRPKYELHGIINKPDRNNSPFQCIHQAILDVKDEMDFVSDSLNGELCRISFGHPQSKMDVAATAPAINQFKLQRSEYQSITGYLHSDIGSVSEEAKLGIIIHDALSQCKNQEEFKILLRKNRADGNLSEHELIESEKAIDRLWLNTDFRRFFDLSIIRHTERELLDHQGNILRPDLVLNSSGTYTVVDFKTGEPREDDKNQVHQYMRLMGEITGAPVNGYLVYFFANRVDKVL